MKCYTYELNRILSNFIRLRGVVFAENKKKAKQAVLIANKKYIEENNLPGSMIIYKPVDPTEPQVIDFVEYD